MTADNLAVEKQAVAVTSLFFAHDVGFQLVLFIAGSMNQKVLPSPGSL
jgi:hypothetical protein